MTPPRADRPTLATTPMTLSMARQPILNAQGQVVAHELFDRSASAQAFTAASDAALLFNLLTDATPEEFSGQPTLFINCTHATLAAGHLDLVDAEHVVLEVGPLPVDQDTPQDIDTFWHSLVAVHARGFKLAFNHTVLSPAYAPWLGLASFIKLDLASLEPAKHASLVQQAQQNPSAQLVAEKVETAAQFEHAKQLGFALFQGYWFAQPVLIKGQTLRPAQAAILQLIHLVRQEASTSEIEEVLKHDPTLSFNLLRFINSAGFGLRCEITSFKHAVMILGLKKLFRWAALLLASARSDGCAPAVSQAAVVRGRLMELLATHLLPPEECDNAFVVGIFSMLDAMLGMAMKDALGSMPLPQTVTDALLHQCGVLAPFLSLTLACESADDAAFAQHATALQLTGDQVNLAHLQALVWAQNMTL